MDVRAKLAELDARGFTVLENFIDAATIDRLHGAFMSLLDPIRHRDRSHPTGVFVVPAGARPGESFAVPTPTRVDEAQSREMPVAGAPLAAGETLVYIPEGAAAGDALDIPLLPREFGEIQSGTGGLAETERYTMHLPWRQPFADPAIYEHPALLELLGLYWGSDDFRIVSNPTTQPLPVCYVWVC